MQFVANDQNLQSTLGFLFNCNCTHFAANSVIFVMVKVEAEKLALVLLKHKLISGCVYVILDPVYMK